jgi:hypothetical protein
LGGYDVRLRGDHACWFSSLQVNAMAIEAMLGHRLIHSVMVVKFIANLLA